MTYVRAVDWDQAQVVLARGYRGQYLYSSERCVVVATKVPPGTAGPPLHVHPSDQTYVVLQGEVDLVLGETRAKVGAGSALLIPAGLPHRNWNAGTVDEIHLEVIAPGVLPNQAIASPVEAVGPVPAGRAHVVRSGPAGPSEDGFTLHWLVNRELGSPHAAVYLASLGPHASGPPLHVHEFDQCYFVLSGVLSVEIALERHEVGPNHLVVLPAGVPHRQWNDRDEPERHLTIIAPEPSAPHSAEHPWDVAVELHPTGEQIG